VDGDGWVSATARCSCGMSSYDYGTGTFIDYCPGCGHYNCLYFEQGPYSGPAYTSPEGLWACNFCDRDYCAKCGKIHSGEGYWLIPTTIPEPEPTPEYDSAESPKEPTREERILDMFNETMNMNTIQLITTLNS